MKRTRKYQYPVNFVLDGATSQGAGNGVLKEACICCGADIPVSWEDEMTREFALVVDVCPKCYQADCSGMSLAIEDSERWCNVHNRQSRPTTLAVDTPSALPKADHEPMMNPPQETVLPESACH